MAKRKKSVQDESGEDVVSSEVSYADTSDEVDSGNYKIGDLSLIDMGEKTDEYEAAPEEENRFAEYEEIDEKSSVAKKLQKTESDEVDNEVNLSEDDEFLPMANYDPEEVDAQYFDS